MVWRFLCLILLTFPLIEGRLCNDGLFECGGDGNGTRCIPPDMVCNGTPDCSNGMDEANCADFRTCPAGAFKCTDGSCIDGSFRCNLQSDCSDGSDELNCPTRVGKGSRVLPSAHLAHSRIWSAVLESFDSCSEPKFKCEAGGPCIVRGAVCDGEKDCPLGDDELNCTASIIKEHQCGAGSMLCKEGSQCIPNSWICDGQKNCPDGSDEMDCESLDGETFDLQSNGHLCGTLEYRCAGQSGLCISLNKTCDSVRDCPAGDDEGEECSQCDVLACHYKCHILNGRGAKCVCPEGSELSDDGVTCTDIDECDTKDGRMCSHYCENKRNRYSCSCAPGYALGNDGHTCRISSSEEADLFVAVGGEIRSMPLYEETPSHRLYQVAVPLASSGTVRSISYMHRNDALFLTVQHGTADGELAVSRNGKVEIIREKVVGIAQVAVDWIGGNVFISQQYPSVKPGISVCSMNGFYCRLLIQGRPLVEGDVSKQQNYKGLALDPEHGIMVWIEKYGDWSRINSAHLDGSNQRVLVDNKLDDPSGLAIDTIKREVYFADLHRNMIEKVHLNTLERTVLVTAGVHQPAYLAIFDGYLYWSDWGTHEVKVLEMSLDHTSPHVLHAFQSFPYGLSINHSMVQPQPTVDPCSAIACQWMCVVAPGPDGHLHPKCICPDYYEQRDNSCLFLEAPLEQDSNAHVGVDIMKKYCATGHGCLNGGLCEDVVNEHGRVINVFCRCAVGYEGLHCEYSNAPLSIDDVSKTHTYPVYLYFFVILAFIAVAFYLAQRKRDTLRLMSAATKHQLNIIPTHMSGTVSKVKSACERLSNRRSDPRPFINVVQQNQFANPVYEEAASATASGMSRSTFNNPIYTEVGSVATFGSDAVFSNHEVH